MVKKVLFLFIIFMIVFIAGCKDANVINTEDIRKSDSTESEQIIQTNKVNNENAEVIKKKSVCITGNYEEERDCFTGQAYNEMNKEICDEMPEDVNERQANKAFCLGFMASVTGDLRICSNQKNAYYENTCELVFERYGMLQYPAEFEELKDKYHSLTVKEFGLLDSDQLLWYCEKIEENVNNCIDNLEVSDQLNNFKFALDICRGIEGDRGYKCIVDIVKKSEYKDYKFILTFCRDSENIFHVASHFCIEPLVEYYQTMDIIDFEWLNEFKNPTPEKELKDLVGESLSLSCDNSCIKTVTELIKSDLKKNCLPQAGSNIIKCTNNKLMQLQDLEDYNLIEDSLKEICLNLKEYGISELYESRCLSDWI